jgi:23S rRNA (pseudouridine1915-N3)-methyltransferase
MLKVKILLVGKTKESWLEEALAEYLKRLKNTVSIEWIWAKDDVHLLELARKELHSICLDPSGKTFTSEQFSSFLFQNWEKHGSRLTFVIGGPDGLPQELKNHSLLISLSPLTFTHQMTRLILIEQIYRAIEIYKGSNYHK